MERKSCKARRVLTYTDGTDNDGHTIFEKQPCQPAGALMYLNVHCREILWENLLEMELTIDLGRIEQTVA